MRRWSARGLAVGALAVVLACAPRVSETRKHLLARLRDARPAARIIAIKQLSIGANREETYAIARAASDATEDVRREVAAALGRSADPSAADLLGSLLRDPADSVRAAAVRALLAKGGPKAGPYVADAYRIGGPLTRVAVSEAPADIFRLGVSTEAAAWRTRIENRRKDGHEEVRAEALAELGRDATLPIIGELSSRLVAPDPILAAAAATGLANAHAVDQVPALIQALRYPSDLVVDAAARSLDDLGPTPAAGALAAALPAATDDTAGHILDALEDAQFTDAARGSACAFALATRSQDLAVRAARLAGPTCAVPPALPAEPARAATRLLILALFDRGDAAVLKRARSLLDDPDANLAAAAAAYIGRRGGRPDAALLARHAGDELVAMRKARSDRAAAANPPPAQPPTSSFQAQLAALLGQENAGAAGAAPKLNRLEQLLASRPDPAALVPLENRPGELDLLAALSVASAHLGGDVEDLASDMLSDDRPAVRALVVDVVDEAGDRGEPLRQRLRHDEDAGVRLRMAIDDVRTGRPEAIDRLAELIPLVDADGRMRIAEALAGGSGPLAPKAHAALVSFAGGDDGAAPVAVRALGRDRGSDVDAALITCLADNPALSGYQAIEALRDHPGPEIDKALAHAAVLPLPDLRAAALSALAARKACAWASRLAPLELDYSGAVRAAVGPLESACAGAK